ncbi:hypothetical protein B0H14DRAFT_2568259 [Mycena olivaceomarginata]|nr:hypothetical protein B0H14DRAFT_2568259 [Mycena olivaceomarginata]
MVSSTPTPTTFDLEAASALVLSPTTPAPPLTTAQDTSSTPIPPTTIPPTTTPPTTTPPTTTPPPTRSNVSTSLQTTAPSGSPWEQYYSDIDKRTPAPTIYTSVTGIPLQARQIRSDSLLEKKFPTGAIVGIVIGICLILLAILFVWHRRRRRQAAYPTAFPITSTNAGTSESVECYTSAAGRHHLRTDSQVGQEKMLSEQSRSLTSSSPPPHPTGRNVQLSVAFGTLGSDSPGAPGPDVVWQLREMTARVRELEAQLESPPPGYSGEEP